MCNKKREIKKENIWLDRKSNLLSPETLVRSSITYIQSPLKTADLNYLEFESVDDLFRHVRHFFVWPHRQLDKDLPHCHVHTAEGGASQGGAGVGPPHSGALSGVAVIGAERPAHIGGGVRELEG